MDNDQARKLVALHENADRALLNLRNANSMATDDPRAPELLSEAGDAYAEAMAALFTEQTAVCAPHLKVTSVGEEMFDEAAASQGDDFEPGKAAYIVANGHGAGFIEDRGDMNEGYLPLRLTTDAHFDGQDFPEGNTIAVAVDCLSLERPEGAVSADVAPAEGSEQGEAPATS